MYWFYFSEEIQGNRKIIMNGIGEWEASIWEVVRDGIIIAAVDVPVPAHVRVLVQAVVARGVPEKISSI